MYRKILVPVDGSDASERGLAEAIKFGKVFGARIGLVHVVNELLPVSADMAAFAIDVIRVVNEAGQAILDNALQEVLANGLEGDAALLEGAGGRAADEILRHASTWRPDLITMGTHGRRGLSRLVLGSDAEHVLREATVPVLFVRAAPTES